MKKLLIFLIILFFTSLLFSKTTTTIIIDKEKLTLEIPDNTADLELVFIESFIKLKRTTEELKSTKELLVKSQKLLYDKDNLLDLTIKHNGELSTLLDNRPRKQLVYFRPNLKLGANFNLDKEINAQVGIGVTVLEWVDIGLLVQIPDINLALLITIYLK